MSNLFETVNISKSLDSGLNIPGVVLVRAGGVSFKDAFEFKCQSYTIDAPERVENNTNFGDAIQVYAFGRGDRTLTFRGYIPFRTAPLASNFLQIWENNIRAKKLAEDKTAKVEVDLAGVGTFTIVPTRIALARSLQIESVVEIDFTGIILTIDPSQGFTAA